MQHRTRVLTTSDGYVGVCSCGYVTDNFKANQHDAARAINDHEVAAMRGGIALDPRQLDLKGIKPK